MAKGSGDLESGSGGGGGGALYPYMIESPQLRWAFIRKVYAIVAFQILATTAVAAAVNFVHPVRAFFLSHTPASLAVLIPERTFFSFSFNLNLGLFCVLFSRNLYDSDMAVLLPMVYFRERHPINLLLLGLFTICISFAVGIACSQQVAVFDRLSMFSSFLARVIGKVVLEAAVLTFVVVVGLTLYTFWAAKRGYDFNFLGPFLSAALLVLIIYCLIQIFIPLGKIGSTIYGCIAAIVFSGFIIYDTDNLIKRHTYDQYICAAISLYLDIINLFMALLTAFGATDS
ncbi:BI1-like protein [Ananas comosus]|uniref:BI1-like protein n=1 Tax=Ananas comosus TaxID=4615 RepID=A0A199V7Y7_ANACO|nr:BI1-like protein [Ananas comosus]